MLSAAGEGVNSAGWCPLAEPSLTVALTTINRWVSGSVRRRTSIRAAEIDIVSFQSLPKARGIRFQAAKAWSVVCITQKRKEEAMKTKTNMKAGLRVQ
jgi:hypothetical protein